MTLRALRRYADTLRHLRLIQIASRLPRLLRNLSQRALPAFARAHLHRRVPTRPQLRILGRPAWVNKPEMAEFGMFRADALERGEFRFLNCAKIFSGAIQWENPELSYLWDFNLHYFEFIHGVAQRPGGPARVHAWMREWIDANPHARQPAWHPYTASLRIAHWVRFFVAHPPSGDGQMDLVRSLYAQCLFLERNLETHLMANHYLENGRALVFGGCFFAGKDADRWQIVGANIVAAEIIEEFLPHGGHYERSPMYHCIVLEGLLDTAQLMRAAGTEPAWIPALRRMCDWLWKIRTPAGWYPLFNDAAFGISAPPDHLFAIAQQHFNWKPPRDAAIHNCDGISVMRTPSWYCAIDGAEIGPSYNPGHAHSDNFTYELFFKGQAVIADTGTHHYDKDPARLAERQTAAHNTVLVNGIEQADVWGGFRVGRRSNPKRAECVEDANGNLRFESAFENKVAPAAHIWHRRVTLLGEQLGLVVLDDLTGQGSLSVESYVHFAPGCTIEPAAAGGWTIDRGTLRLHLAHTDAATATIDDYHHSPQFGLSVPAKRLKLTQHGEGAQRLAYAIANQPRQLHCTAAGQLRVLDAAGTEFACEPERPSP